MSTATPTLSDVASRKQEKAFREVYLPWVHGVSQDKPMSVEDKDAVYSAMETLGYAVELFDSDVECLRSLAKLTATQVDHKAEDKIDRELLDFLTKYVARQAVTAAPTRKATEPTAAAFDAVIAKADESIAIRARITELLGEIYFRRQNGNGTVSLRGTLSSKMKEIEYERSEAMKLRTLLTQFHDCNRRLFHGDYRDTRPSWNVREVQEAANGQRPVGSANFLPGRSPLEERLRPAEKKPDGDGWAVFRNPAMPAVTPTPYRP
jgi:hypothetical protein